MIPLVCAAVASGVLLAVKALISAHSNLGADDGTTAAVIFVVATIVGGFVTFFLGRRTVTLPPTAVNWPVIVVPAAIHVTCYLLFLFRGFTLSPLHVDWTQSPVLVASIPIQLLGGLFVFTQPWRR